MTGSCADACMAQYQLNSVINPGTSMGICSEDFNGYRPGYVVDNGGTNVCSNARTYPNDKYASSLFV